MSISPFEFGQFKRQQGMLDPMWAPHPLSSMMMQPPWGMQHGPSMNRIEYEETPDSHKFKVRVHGKEDVRVRVEEGRVLHISAKGADHKEERKEGGSFYRVERSCGEFVSKFKLPEDADADRVTSSVDCEGNLTVVAPRRRLNAPVGYCANRNYY